ncbi:MAG: hypothetical protein EZS28_026184, partial [Streblomastix strix]
MERSYDDTKNLIVGIFNVMFVTYKLLDTGSRMPYLDKHVKYHSVHYIDSDYKICFFIALSYKIRSEIDTKVNNNSVITFAKQLFAYDYRVKGKYQLFEYLYNDKAKKNQSLNKYLQDYQGFNISTEMTKFIDTFNLVVNIYTYHEELEGKTGQYRLFNSYGQLNNESMTLDLLLISDGTEQHVLYVSNVEKLTGVLICPYCHDYVTILSNTNKRANEYFNIHVEKYKSSAHEPSILLHDVPMPICPAVLNHPTVQYLMAYGIMDQFKAQRGFITYDFATLSDQVMKNITDQTTLLSQLSKLSIASTEVFPNQDKSYEVVKRCYSLFDELSENYQELIENYGLPSNSSFVHLWLAQTFESAEQIYQCMKYDNENIPFDRCVKILGWNSSRFDIALLCDALDCELWTMGVPIGDLNNTKSITVTHKKSHMKLQFIDAENLFGPMTLKACVKDYGDKSEHKDVFPYEIINSKNWNEVLVKTKPFEYEDFKSQLKGGYSMTKDEYDQYLIDFNRFTNRLEYLKYYNINDTEIMVKPLINLIDTFEQFNIDVLHYISIASCAYATKHYSKYFPSKFNLESDKQTYYSDFDINADYSNPNSKAKPFVLTVEYWKNKCYLYKQQDYKAGRETEKNVTADDNDYYKKLFETSVCSICSAKFTYYNPPSLDRQDNELPHTKENCLPACVSCNTAHANRDPKIASLHIKMRQYAIKHNLSMTISDERIYKLLQECITGGLAAVFHRENIAVIDLGFVITDYKSVAVFEKNTAYESFVRTMMNLRIQAILAGSTKEKFYKLIINASYGYDTLNTEKFGKIKMLDKADTFNAQHHPSHIGTRRISANTFAVQIKPKIATCFTSIQSGVFTLDNAKYCYLNYIYNFMYKCLDRKRFHFVLADTDSIYIAIAGDPAKDCHQQFESIVTDKQFYDQHVYQYLPDPNKDIYDYKKILGFGIENEGYELTSLGPK